MVSGPGRSIRWYVFPRTKRAPVSCDLAGRQCLHAALRADRHEGLACRRARAGVSKTARGRSPSRAMTRKANPAVGGVNVPPEKHGVPVGEEAIPLSHGETIRLEDALGASESAHHGEERRARQMEVREEAVDDAPRVARLDEQRVSLVDCAHVARALGVCRALECADRRRSHCDDWSISGARVRDRRRPSTGSRQALRVHRVQVEIVDGARAGRCRDQREG
jgi:hypothetical protein